MLVITILVPFIIISLIILFIIGLKVQTEEGEDELLKNIYIYLVLFATLMMSIGGSIGAFMALADMVSPAPYHQSFEEFKMWGTDYEGDGEKASATKSDAELRESYDAMIQLEKDNSVKQAKNYQNEKKHS